MKSHTLVSLWIALNFAVNFSVFAHSETSYNLAEDTDYSRVFREGTSNLISAQTYAPDTLYLLFSHNFLSSSFPYGSNPAFYASYTPWKHIQIDSIMTIRSSPLELELGATYQLLDETQGDWLNLASRIAYNNRGHIFGFDLSASRFLIPEIWQVSLNYRFLSNAQADGFNRPVNGLGAHTIVRVYKHWHLFTDIVLPLDTEILQQRSPIWQVGIKKRIPHTPHILTLYAGNTQQATLSGRTISPGGNLADVFRVGFVFSIDIPALSHLPARLF